MSAFKYKTRVFLKVPVTVEADHKSGIAQALREVKDSLGMQIHSSGYNGSFIAKTGKATLLKNKEP